MSQHLFVTGMPRSGTTLLDKVLSLHPEAFLLSQPLPLLYTRVKLAFLQQAGRRGAGGENASGYPLSDMFGARYYPPEELTAFLQRFALCEELSREALEEMLAFDGQYTKPRDPYRILDEYRPLPLFDFVTAYCRQLLPRAGLRVAGSKETYCFEYIPYYRDRGAKVILLVRDPRDVITSLNHGSGRDYGGPRKPNLFNIRQWRTSVAFALAWRDDPGCLVVKYEDLVERPVEVFGRITAFLDLEPLPAAIIEGPIRAQSGERWTSNSSHAPASRITSRSVGRFRESLAPELDLFVQATCFPELAAFGYSLDIEARNVPAIIDGYRPAEALERAILADWRWSEQRRDEEQRRWRNLQVGQFEPREVVLRRAFDSLRLCISPATS